MISGMAMGFTCCHGPSGPVKHAGRKKRAPQPGAPKNGAEEKAGLLRSG
jgi:hypothetical protein